MKFTVSALLLLSSLTFVCPLCTPPQWEGVQEVVTSGSDHGIIETYAVIHYDYTNQRSAFHMSTYHSGKVSLYNIVTIYKDGKGVEYTSRYYPYQPCVRRNLTTPFLEKCVPAGSNPVGNFYLGETGEFLVRSFAVSSDQLTIKFDVSEKTPKTMIPLMETMKGTLNQKEIFQDTVYKNITTGIRDTHVFTIPSDCEEGKVDNPWFTDVALSSRKHSILGV